MATESEGPANVDDTKISEGTQPNAGDQGAEQNAGEEKIKMPEANAEDAEMILRALAGHTEPVVVLTGEAGTGKTWLAQQVAKSAVKGPFYMHLWISLNHDKESVHQSIARQLSIPTRAEVWEDDDSKDDGYTDTHYWEKELKTKVIEKLGEKIEEMRNKKSEKKDTFLLLVLDSDEPQVDNTEVYNYNDIMGELFSSEPLKQGLRTVKKGLEDSFHMKVLITTRQFKQISIDQEPRVFEVQPLSGDKAKEFLKGRVSDDFSKSKKFRELSDAIGNRKRVLPPQIMMLAEALNHIPRNYSEALDAALKIGDGSKIKEKPISGGEAESLLNLKQRVGDEDSESPIFKKFFDAVEERSEVLTDQIKLAEILKITKNCSETLESAFDEALNILQNAGEDDPMPLLQFAYEKLPGDCMTDCFWHSWNFLGNHVSVHYNELITHWMLEGHLDLAGGLEKAYYDGYDIMMSLIDRGMLKMQGGNLVGFEAAILSKFIKTDLTLKDLSPNCRGLFDTSKLGLGSVLVGESRNVFKRMAPADGMMKTVKVGEDPLSSLLIDGSRLCREVPDTFFQSMQMLQVLALFQPRFTSLPKSISEMKNLLVFVLRDCSLLKDIKGIENLENLIVLEISGSPFLKEISDNVFKNMSKLRSLNLSDLGIGSLPPTFSDLAEIRRLIIRRCSSLKALPKLGKFKALEVIDLSGSLVIDLSGSSSSVRIQEKSFKSFEKLRVINFSGTKIEKLPIVQTLPELTLLLIKGCDSLSGLRFMKHLQKLKVLDVSGATKIKEIFYDCFTETDNLRVLDLSETDIRFLPDSLSKHLCHLRLKGCSKLEKLSSTKELKDLESLDLSYASGLKKFPDEFFKYLTNLQSLDLSNTNVESLPSLSNQLPKLQRLFLKHCLFEALPDLKVLTSLVELDLSNCENLKELPNLTDNKHLEIINLSSCKHLSAIQGSFEHMSQLQVLDLSDTLITSLPSLSKPSKLRSLILKNCTKLENSPEFEILSQLEQLDLRGTTSLKGINAKSLNDLKQLQTLKLSKIALDEGMQFSELTGLTTLSVLDLSGEAVESLPPLDSLSNLQQLLLRGCSSLKELPSLKTLSHLEVLDLSGTKVENFGDKVSELTQLKRLHLPQMSIEGFKKKKKENATEETNRRNFSFPPLEIKFDRCCISNSSEIPEGGDKPSVVELMHGTQLFESLKENPKLLDRIKQSIWTISSGHSSDTQGKCEDNYGDSRRHIFSDIYSKIRKLDPLATDGQVLEIQGFDKFHDDIGVVLELANHIILVENQFLKKLSDFKSSLKNMKGCWLERCTNVESIFTEGDLEMGENLEILWISNLPNLKRLCKADLQSKNFGNLKDLYIDCCPTLETAFSSTQLPATLETLQIMFCDKLKSVFGAKDTVTSEVKALSSTGKEVQPTSSAKKDSANTGVQTTASESKEKKEMQNTDKKVQNPTSGDKEMQTPEADEEVQSESSKDKEAHTPMSTDRKEQNPTSGDKEMQTPAADEEVHSESSKDKEALTPTSTDKKVPTPGSEEKEAHTAGSVDKEVRTPTSENRGMQITTKLKKLHISYCPELETVFSSGQLPKTLEVLQIKFCRKLKNLSGQELNKSELPNLQTLHLLELPSWTGSSIERNFNKTIIKNVKGIADCIPAVESTKTETESKETPAADGN